MVQNDFVDKIILGPPKNGPKQMVQNDFLGQIILGPPKNGPKQMVQNDFFCKIISGPQKWSKTNGPKWFSRQNNVGSKKRNHGPPKNGPKQMVQNDFLGKINLGPKKIRVHKLMGYRAPTCVGPQHISICCTYLPVNQIWSNSIQ